jgi:hypothetical protein
MNIIFQVILLPFALVVWYICIVLDWLQKWVERRYEAFNCMVGNHYMMERGPHRQSCVHCQKHFDLDLMATNLDENRIGFFEQTLYLGAVGKVDELPWLHEVQQGETNVLCLALRTYDELCAAWSGRKL